MSKRRAVGGQDPYLRWALETGGRYLVHGQTGPLRLAGELRPGCKLPEAVDAVQACGGTLTGRSILGTAFFTAALASPSLEAFSALQKYARVVLAEPGMKSVDPTVPACGPYVDWKQVPGAGQRPTALKRRVVIGVVDGACGFANRAFDLSPHRSRLDAFWDQGTVVSGTHWKAPAHLPFGRELDRQALNAVVKQVSRPTDAARATAERSLYLAMGHTIPDDADWSHGTHVLDTVLSGLRELPDRGRPGVVYVQLPECALRDTSARWAAAWVLDAIQYIVDHAATDAKVVINLSLGAFAGPQDGSSLLERAIDTIAQNEKGRIAFVVAAGNAGLIVDDGSGVTKSCHARFLLEAADAPNCAAAQKATTLVWDIDVPDSTDSFMELWLPELVGDAAAAGVAITLEGDGVSAMSTGRVEPGGVRFIGPPGDVIAMVANCTGSGGVPNGSGGMALVALAHTSSAARARAPAGRWKVTVENRCNVPLAVDARIERRDVPGDLRGFRPQYGFAADCPHVGAAGTLGSLANGKRSIVVGALVPEDAPDPLAKADYSSEGFGAGVEGCNARTVRRRGPDVYSRGRLEAAAYFSGANKSLDGTSMAAAQVSGAMAAAFLAPQDPAAQAPLDTLHAFVARGSAGKARGQVAGAGSHEAGLRRPAGTSGGGFVVDPQELGR